jgi:antitoxin ParD1/3/4
MNVSLTPELESLVNNKVKSGLYNSASEVVREALRLLEEDDRIKAIRRDELIKEIKKGTDQIKNGQGIEIKSIEESREYGESVIRRGRAKLEAENRKK